MAGIRFWNPTGRVRARHLPYRPLPPAYRPYAPFVGHFKPVLPGAIPQVVCGGGRAIHCAFPPGPDGDLLVPQPG